ncbi:MAG: cystathionine beta-lyase [Alphaproteobacteria bacterium]|nr:cystathionine beta-lyase [Alphaproteobacteria bacterium]
MRPETALIHRYRNSREQHGAVNPPIVHASTILFPTLAELDSAHQARSSYGLHGTVTHFGLIDNLSEMEGAFGGHLVPSGLAAITISLMTFLKAGDHLLVPDNCYQPTRRFADNVLAGLDISTTYYVPSASAEEIAELLRSETSVILLESPGSDTFEMQDIPAIALMVNQRGIKTIMDNTWAAGYFFKPLEHGVDISIQAVTKYVAGHSDCLLGFIAARTEEDWKRVDNTHYAFGTGHCSAEIAYLAARGLRSMPARLRVHQSNALTMAEWLESRPEVLAVHFPALPSHSGYQLWKRDYTGATSLFAFEIPKRNRSKLALMLDRLKYYGMGYSWGGYESLLIPKRPQITRSHAGWPNNHQLLRIHVGLEHIDDLIDDLDAGLKRYLS